MNAFRNAFKVIANRFAFLWTHIAYYVLAVFLLISLNISILVPYINKIVENFNFIGRVSEIGQAMLDNAGFENIIDLGKAFFADLGGIFTGGNSFSTILIFLALSIVSRFLMGLADIAFYHVIDMHLSSAARQSFRASFIKNIGKSSLYQLCKMLFTVPCDFAVFGLVWLASLAFGAPILMFLAPFLVVLTFVAFYSLRLTLFSGWVPQILHDEKQRIFPSFFNSVKLSFKHFARVYGAMLLYMLLIIAINIFFGIFTLGVGLIVTVPLSMYIMNVLNSTLFYQNSNLRYYVDKNTIIN